MKNIRRQNILGIIAVVLVLVFANVISSYIFTRFDLTTEKRYTLSDSTKKMLKELDEQVLFRVYLEGDELPAEYRRFRNDIKNMLDQFRAYSKNVEYEFVNPNSFDTDEEKIQFYQTLVKKGIKPIPIATEDDGVQKQQVVYPAMEVSYKGRETAMQLQSNTVSGKSADEIINSSIENLEYNFVTAIHRLTRPVQARIGFLMGHNELEKIDIYDIQMSLVEDYKVENVYLDRNINALTGRIQNLSDSSISVNNKYDVLVVPKPLSTFTDMDLYIIDQFVMYGGKILWLQQKEPDAFHAMTVFLCPKDYLRYRLTGTICMDVSEASGTGLFDTAHRRWCWEIIDQLHLPHSLFPETLESTEKAGARCSAFSESSVWAPFVPNMRLKLLFWRSGILSAINTYLQSEQMHWYLVFGKFSSSIITANSVNL